ncbi:MAG: hypothetical protein KZQ64_12510 [gamma proteobacterium symbiont of Bathyaustriella thionipta]|nr:hypothetical protein [gamma proteobacterium symbiont of Bathyaustriella thionipta]
MKATKLLHKMLEKTCPDIHKSRLNALMAGVQSGAKYHQISVTSLGRNLRENSVTSTKHPLCQHTCRLKNLVLGDKNGKIYPGI